MRTVNAARYVTLYVKASRLPAIIKADDDGMYVLKFRGAGQGTKALIAELIAGEIAGEIARVAGLLVPELVLVSLDPEIAKTEPDPEINISPLRGETGRLALAYRNGFDASAFYNEFRKVISWLFWAADNALYLLVTFAACPA